MKVSQVLSQLVAGQQSEAGDDIDIDGMLSAERGSVSTAALLSTAIVCIISTGTQFIPSVK